MYIHNRNGEVWASVEKGKGQEKGEERRTETELGIGQH